MDDGNWTEDLEAERKAMNIVHIDHIRDALRQLWVERPDDKKLFVELTKIIGSLAGLKADL